MNKIICALIVLAMLCIMAMPVMAQLAEDARLAELRAQYQVLARQKLEIETQMIRLEGQFIERQKIIAEETIAITEEEEAKEVEE